MAHMLDLPGCIVRAPSREQALSQVAETIRETLAWLRRHGEPTPAAAEDAIKFQIAGESTGFGPFDPRSAAALFPPDREPVALEEMERYFRLMGYTRAQLTDTGYFFCLDQLSLGASQRFVGTSKICLCSFALFL